MAGCAESRLERSLLLGVTVFACLTAGASAQMATAGSFGVSTDGAATYTIPIRVPPGVAGIEPHLALIYDSRGDNGPFGLGWRLTGLSAISRCPRTVAQDGVHGSVNFDGNDRFCLDGQPLLLLSGTGAYGAAGSEYRTEIPTFSRIVANGSAGLAGPASFTVYTKDGLTVQYGATADSLINGQGSFTPMTWAMNRAQDRKGNYLTVSYNTAAAKYEYNVARINYAGTSASAPNQSVLINYNTAVRSDQTTGYGPTGIAVQMTQWVSNIQVLANGSLVRQYTPTYSYSTTSSRLILTTLQECAPSTFGSTTADACLPAHTFTWSNGNLALADFNLGQIGLLGYVGATYLMGDFNGDGLTDLIAESKALNSDQAVVEPAVSDGTQFVSPVAGTVPVVSIGTGLQTVVTPAFLADVNGDGVAEYVVIYGLSPNVLSGPAQILLGDIDGDGRADVIQASTGSYQCSPCASQASISTGLSTGSSFATLVTTTFTPPPANTVYSYALSDLNGDGCEDLIQIASATQLTANGIGAASYSYSANAWMSNCSTLLPPAGAAVPIATVSFNATKAAPTALPTQWITGDFNGDLLGDLVAVIPSMTTFPGNATWNAYVLLSNSKGLNTPLGPFALVTPAASYDGTVTTGIEVFGIDFNGDGRTDLLAVYNNAGSANAQVFFWNGTTFVKGPLFTQIGTWDPVNITDVAMDINGDSRIDLVRLPNYNSSVVPNVLTQVGPPFDTVVGFSNGLGWSATVAYSMLSEKNVPYPSPPLTRPAAIGPLYTKGSSQTYPRMDFAGPRRVVNYTKTDSGAGTLNTTFYSYAGGVMDLQGRGWQGFTQVNGFDQTADVVSSATYSTAFPYSGMTLLGQRYVPNSTGGVGTLLGTVTNTLTSVPASDNGAAFPYVGTSVVQPYEPSTGHALPSSTSNLTFDGWGQLTQATVSTSDGFSQTTTNSYLPVDTTNWYLGRLQQTKVSRSSPSSPAANPTPPAFWVTVSSQSGGASMALGSISATATISQTGGTAPITYTWTGGANGITASQANSNSTQVTFTGSFGQYGIYPASFTLTAHDAAGHAATVAYTVVLSNAVSITPASTSWGTVGAASDSGDWFTVKNNTASTSVTFMNTAPASGPAGIWSYQGAAGYCQPGITVLGPGASCQSFFGISTAATPGSYTAVEQVGYEAQGPYGTQPPMFNIQQSYGFSIATTTSSVSSLNFGSQALNTTSAPQTLSLTNNATNGGPLHVAGITMIGAQPANFPMSHNCGTAIAAGTSCTVTVQFTPTTGVGNFNAAVQVQGGYDRMQAGADSGYEPSTTGVNFTVPVSGASRVSSTVTISANTANYTLQPSTVPGYSAGRTDVTLTINPGVYVYSTSSASAALTIQGFTSSDTVTIAGGGIIYGAGGAGGAANSGKGTAGGDAISLGYPITFASGNTLTVGGGGGGGGSGGGDLSGGSPGLPVGAAPLVRYYGGGGGAGAGFNGATGGAAAGGAATAGASTASPSTSGAAGGTGTTDHGATATGGAGGGPGASGAPGTNNGASQYSGGGGGGGGGLGGAGGAGAPRISNNGGGGGTGGAAGYAVRKNGNAVTGSVSKSYGLIQ